MIRFKVLPFVGSSAWVSLCWRRFILFTGKEKSYHRHPIGGIVSESCKSCKGNENRQVFPSFFLILKLWNFSDGCTNVNKNHAP